MYYYSVPVRSVSCTSFLPIKCITLEDFNSQHSWRSESKIRSYKTHAVYRNALLRRRYNEVSCFYDIILLSFFQNPYFKTLRQSLTSMGQTVG